MYAARHLSLKTVIANSNLYSATSRVTCQSEGISTSQQNHDRTNWSSSACGLKLIIIIIITTGYNSLFVFLSNVLYEFVSNSTHNG